MTHTHSIVHHNQRRLVESRAPRLIVASVAALLAIPAMARAQAPAEPVPAFARTPVPDKNLPGAKSPGTALALSLVPTAVGAGLLVASREEDGGLGNDLGGFLFFAGPNIGHFYAGESATGLAHIGVRAGAAGAILAGAAWTFVSSCSLGLFGEANNCDAPPPGAATLMIGGAVVMTASAAYSIYDAPRAAERANARLRARRLALTPAPVAGPDGASGLGLHMSGRF
jgi:hypothetical protein